MAKSCCQTPEPDQNAHNNPRWRLILWIALIANAAMFIVEIIAGVAADSRALQADALDFFADAANYGISLFVLGMALRWRAVAALIKGASMGLFGLFVTGSVVWHALNGTVPAWGTMSAIGALALIANVACLGLLFAWREGDANMRSVWICSRNDVLANLAVVAAAFGVFGSGTGWPDIIVATIMAGLALQGAWAIIRDARRELREVPEENMTPVQAE